MKKNNQIFIDSDGVTADFDALAEEIFGMPSREYEAKYGEKAFWDELEAHEDFFGSLPLMGDAMILYEAVRHLDPIFLSGVPRGTWASPQKERWYAKHFPNNRLITCASRDKFRHMTASGDILIDDWPKHRHIWEGAGGIFILHTSAEDSIVELEEMGIL